MPVPKKNRGVQDRHESLPKVLPNIVMRHGEAVWLLTALGFRGRRSEGTFSYYIKSLRRLGIPFPRGEIGFARRGQANYSYDHLMELALTLTLRVYHVVPDAILAEIVRHRRSLYRLYRRAYSQRCTGTGSPILIKTSGCEPIRARGLFLDLKINFSGGRLVSFGPPRLLSPFEALTTFVERNVSARALLPINLSLLSEKIVALSLQAPVIRRGPRPTWARASPLTSALVNLGRRPRR